MAEEQKISTIRFAFQLLAVVLMTSYFLFQAYEIFMNKDKWASSFYSAYGNFEMWWNKHFKRLVWNEFAYEMPDQRDMYPFKAKVALALGYGYGFGTLLLLTGEKWAALILCIPHLIVSVITNAPSQAKTSTMFGTAEQGWCFDLMILFSMIMITGSSLQIATAKKESGKKITAEK